MLTGDTRKRKLDQSTETKLVESESKKETLPPHAKPMSRLQRDDKESKVVKSAHSVYPVKKIKLSKPGEYRLCFFKEHTAGSEISQLEAYNAEICKLIATSHFVPKTSAYYDDDTQIFLGVGSHAIENFTSNAQDPLTEDNLACRHSFDEIDFKQLEKKELKSNSDEKKQFDETQLKNYKMVKGLAISLMTRYLFKEDDTHNCNISKYGFMIDFDMTKWNILCHFKKLNSLEKILRTPCGTTFKCTENDILHFPDIKDATPHYWPTKQTKFSNHFIATALFSEHFAALEKYFISADDEIYKKFSTMTAELAVSIYQSEEQVGCLDRIARRIFEFILKLKDYFIRAPEKFSVQQKKEIFKIFQKNILENMTQYQNEIVGVEEKLLKQIDKPKQFFSEQDNKVYKQLAEHPVFIFYKYKTLLKYILTDKNIYHAIALLHINPNQSFSNQQGQKRNLITELINDEAERIDEVKKVIMNVPEFKDFLIKHGKLALELIKDEFEEFKQKYAAQLSKKPFYRNILEAIDIEKIESRFKEIHGSLILRYRKHS